MTIFAFFTEVFISVLITLHDFTERKLQVVVRALALHTSYSCSTGATSLRLMSAMTSCPAFLLVVSDVEHYFHCSWRK
jgi:hypothetical protein